MAKAKGPTFPKTLGECADALYTARQNRLALQRQIDEMGAYETALREHIINTLPKSKQEGAQGSLARVTVVRKEVPQVKDWTAFQAFIKKTGAWELMQRRPSEAALKERLDAGVKVPGVDVFHAVTLSVNKV